MPDAVRHHIVGLNNQHAPRVQCRDRRRRHVPTLQGDRLAQRTVRSSLVSLLVRGSVVRRRDKKRHLDRSVAEECRGIQRQLERLGSVGPIDQMHHDGGIGTAGDGPDHGTHLVTIGQPHGRILSVGVALGVETEGAGVLIVIQVSAVGADEPVEIGILRGRAEVPRRVTGHVHVPRDHAVASAGIGRGNGLPCEQLPSFQLLAIALLRHRDNLASAQCPCFLHAGMEETGCGVTIRELAKAPIELQLNGCPSPAAVVARECHVAANMFVQSLSSAFVEGDGRLGLKPREQFLQLSTVPTSEVIAHRRVLALEQLAVVKGLDVVDAQLLL